MFDEVLSQIKCMYNAQKSPIKGFYNKFLNFFLKCYLRIKKAIKNATTQNLILSNRFAIKI